MTGTNRTSFQITSVLPRRSALRSAGIICAMALMATSLVACGGNAVLPGDTNQAYGTASSGTPSITQNIPPKTSASASTTTSASTRVTTTTRSAKPGSARKTVAIPPRPIKSIKAETLMGLSETAVKSQIGAPEMIRGEGPTRVWQYRSDECSFDAFFFPGTEGETRKMTHMLARLRKSADKISVQDCLDQVLKSRSANG
ncbi:hypothetical protein [Thalassospira alkalitolerans]|nr:hypothetical protein [Thalassospira alkalitolerans]